MRVALRTGGARRSALPLFRSGEGEPQILIGTHALLYDTIALHRISGWW